MYTSAYLTRLPAPSAATVGFNMQRMNWNHLHSLVVDVWHVMQHDDLFWSRLHARCPQLKQLTIINDLPRCALDETWLHQRAKLMLTPLIDAGWPCRLKQLNLFLPSLLTDVDSHEQLPALVQCLEHLGIEDWDVQAQYSSLWRSLSSITAPRLTSLTLSGNSTTESWIALTQQLDDSWRCQVQSLKLMDFLPTRRARISYCDMTSVFPQLRHLHVANVSVGYGCWSKDLDGLPSTLETLCLSNVKFADHLVLMQFASLPRLRSLSLDNRPPSHGRGWPGPAVSVVVTIDPEHRQQLQQPQQVQQPPNEHERGSRDVSHRWHRFTGSIAFPRLTSLELRQCIVLDHASDTSLAWLKQSRGVCVTTSHIVRQ